MITGLGVMVTMWLCNVRLALVWGVMAFQLNFIPNVGSFLALMVPLPVILLDDGLNIAQLLCALVIPAVIQLSVGNGLEPMMFGAMLNLTSISILASLVLFGAMWGLCGAVLSVPLLAIIRIVLTRADHPLAKRLLHLIRENTFASMPHIHVHWHYNVPFLDSKGVSESACDVAGENNAIDELLVLHVQRMKQSNSVRTRNLHHNTD